MVEPRKDNKSALLFVGPIAIMAPLMLAPAVPAVGRSSALSVARRTMRFTGKLASPGW
jgi:hypothetical protein